MPFEKLVEELQPERDLSRQPIFQVMFGLQNLGIEEEGKKKEEEGKGKELGGLRVEEVEGGEEEVASKFDVMLLVWENEEGMRGTVEYNRDLFDRGTVERMVKGWKLMLEQVVKEAEVGIGRMEMLSEAERREVEKGYGGEDEEEEGERESVLERVEREGKRRPERIALVDGEEKKTYGELAEEAEQWGRYLRRKEGVREGERVGVYVEGSMDWMVVSLGVMKSGGVLVGMEVGEAEEQLRGMVERSKVRVVISRRGLWEGIGGEKWGIERVRMIEEVMGEVRGEWVEGLEEEAGVEGVEGKENVERVKEEGERGRGSGGEEKREKEMCVVYGLGRRGEVEGLVLGERALSGGGERGEQGWKEWDRVGMEWGYGKELGSIEIFRMLARGVCLVKVEEGGGPRKVAEELKRRGVTVWWSRARMVERVGEEFGWGLKGVRQVVCEGGMWEEERLQERLKEKEEVLERVYGVYGYRETGGAVLLYGLRGRKRRREIGMEQIRGGMRLNVLNEEKVVAGEGEWGEIHVGGKGLALGYEGEEKKGWEENREGLKYGTGDWVWRRGEGEVEYRGRRDGRVKVGWMRVEAEGIERLLEEEEGVEEAGVVLVEGRGGELGERRRGELVGLVVGEEGVRLEGEELARGLAGKLRGEQIPRRYVQVKELEKGEEGEIKRRWMEKRVSEEEEKKREEPEYEGPRNEIEEEVAEIWGKTFGVERVGIREDFFRLGGHSLLATQVVARISDRMGVEVPLRKLFEAPTIAGLAEVIGRELEEGRKEEKEKIPVLERVGREEALPLSYAQQRLWFLDQLDPGTAAYSMRIGIRLRGELDRVGTEWSLREIVSRHEVLRTTFPAYKGTPVQKISSVPEFGWKETDLRHLPAAEREVETRRLATQEGGRVFDLSRGPLLWMELLRLGEQEHVLLVNMHNIIADLWSAGIMMREFSELYATYVRGQELVLAELPIQYGDYAVWQRKWLQGEVLERQLGYWQKQLAEVQALELPTDRPRPPMRSYLGGSVPIDFGTDLSRQVKEFSRREGVTLFMTLLTAFNVVLARYAGQKDIAVGTHVANRRRAETERLIGLFLNDVVLRTDLSGNPGFSELLRRIRQTTLQAYEHQDIPFDRLVDTLQSKRDLSRAPLFQASLHLLNTPEAVLNMPGITLQWLDISHAVARNDLELVFTENKEGLLTGTAVYATDLFDGRTIERLVGHMANVLAEVVRNGEQKIEEVNLLSAAERAEILGERNQTEVELLETTAQELMEGQAQRRQEAVAVECEEESWSYGELNRRANQLAHYLRRLGVGPEVRVGIYMARTAEMVVGFLGVLKAGGVYVPLDPGYPGERLAYMVEDANVSVVLSGEAQVPWKELTKKVKVIWTKQEWALIGAESETNLDKVVDGENLAYVVYTSGSTGRPKGAMITHYGLTNHLRAKIVDLELAHQDVVAQNSPSSFDISIWQILAPLAVGGRVCVIKDDPARDVGELLKACQERGVTVLETVPTMLAVMISEQKGRRRVGLDRLRWLICQAEPLPNDMIKQWREIHPHVGLMNAYGATECSDDVSHCHIEEELPEGLAYGPLGNPLMNAKIFVLDRRLEAVPVGVMGEMYIGGKVLGRGYLDRPELTAERFIPNPHCGCGERMYWTGDVGRWRQDGLLEFIGRVDNQVKLRGQRVELGEIEAALNEHADVEQAIVTVNEDKWGEKRLVAYLVARKTAEEKEDQENEPIADQVQSWIQVFDTTYTSGDGNQEPTFDLTGWNSSYTGLPIPQPEMQEWLDGTLQRIQKLKASRVLEIGCGSGMLLFRTAPQCDRYCATDVSVQGLKRLRQRLDALGGYEQVSLMEREANDFSGLAETFDAILLNSVVQFFPSLAYLRQVLDGAIASLREGGFIFLGDVRSLPLLQAFHASVFLEKASPTMDREEFRQRVMQRVIDEEEFAVAPAFFQKLQQEIAGIKKVLILPRKGRIANELTKFRYDVIIEVGCEKTAAVDDIVWLDWNRDRLNLESVSSMLASQANKRVGIASVPNKRLNRERKLQRWLDGAEGPATVEEMRRSLELQDQYSGVELHDLWDMTERFPCNVELGWGQHTVDGSFDVLFVPRSENGDRWEGIELPLISGQHLPWSACANDPLLSARRKKLISELRSSLLQRLPEYMVPSFYVPLDKLPLTPNGKVDRKSLPAPDFENEETNQSYSAPRTLEEEILCGIVSSVLNRQQIGIDDNFFEMGGHSLLATQVVSRVRSAFSIEMPLRAIFESPTVAGIAQQIRRELEKGKTVEVPILKRRSNAGTLPLSYAQQRLWFLDQLQPNSSAYNISSALRLRGELRVELLERAMEEIVRRHEVLRTRFENVGGEPRQVIEVESRVGLPVVDLSGLESREREVEVRKQAQEESEGAFDLGRGPLLRVKLVRLGEQEHVLLVTMHHIVSDGWSMGIMVQECGELYQAYSEGRESGLAELEVQYGDYAVWQREWMRGEVLEEQLRYWRKQLGGVGVLELPTDRPRPALQTNAGAIVPFVIREELSAGLKELSRREGVTLFMTLLGAFQVLLWRYSGERDIAVGAPIAGRRWKEIEGLIGFFVNTLVMRTKINGGESFGELLEGVRETTLEAYRHQDVPFEKLVEELQPERDLSRQPFFQIMLALLNTGPAELELPNLKLNTFAFEDKTRAAKFDLVLSMVDHKQGISGFFEYNTDLFDHATVALMLRRFQLMLEQVVKEAEVGIGRMEMLSEAERREVEKGYGGEDEEEEGERESVLERVEREGKRRPERIALVDGEEKKTYGELAEEAEQWGRYLRRKEGVREGERVGVYVEGSMDWMVVSLGVMKSGGVLVGMEVGEAEEQLRGMVERSKVRVVISRRGLWEGIGGEKWGIERVRMIEEVMGEVRGEWVEGLEEEAGVEGVEGKENVERVKEEGERGRGSGGEEKREKEMCVVYGLGRRGEVEGLVLGERALSGGGERGEQGWKEWDRVGMEWGYGKELGSIEIFRMLARGVCLVKVEEGGGPRKVAEELKRRGVTVWWSRARMVERVGEEFGWGLKGVRQVVCEGGMWEEERLQERLKEKEEVLERVYGVYGYRETGGAVLLYGMRGRKRRREIGMEQIRGGMRLNVLNEEKEVAGEGEWGEIYVGGKGLALGYEGEEKKGWEENREGLKYGTGDWVWRRGEGEVEYRGRRDGRVKVGWMRVEAEGIERLLEEEEGVEEAGVVLVEGRGGELGERRRGELVGLVVGEEGVRLEGEELARGLAGKLRGEQIPRRYVQVKELEKGEEGEIKRRWMEKRVSEEEEKKREEPEYEGPRNEIEEEVAEIWGKTFGVERVGIREDFFRLGRALAAGDAGGGADQRPNGSGGAVAEVV